MAVDPYLIYTPEILDRIKAHNLWIVSNGEEGTQAIFDGMDLTGIIFYRFICDNFSLEKMSFKGTNLVHAQFIGAGFEEVNFREADMTYSVFSLCNCQKVNFENAIMDNTMISLCKLEGANFTGVNTNRILFEHCEGC